LQNEAILECLLNAFPSHACRVNDCLCSWSKLI